MVTINTYCIIGKFNINYMTEISDLSKNENNNQLLI